MTLGHLDLQITSPCFPGFREGSKVPLLSGHPCKHWTQQALRCCSVAGSELLPAGTSCHFAPTEPGKGPVTGSQQFHRRMKEPTELRRLWLFPRHWQAQAETITARDPHGVSPHQLLPHSEGQPGPGAEAAPWEAHELRG